MITKYKVPHEQREQIIRESISLAFSVKVDQLDCSKSWIRQPTDKTVEEVIQIGLKDKKTLWNFIHRGAICGDDAHFDVGFSTTSLTPDYFLWISLTEENGHKIIEKYGLTTCNN